MTFDLPLSPSLNEMLSLAKKRTRRSRSGGWMRQSLPVVYDQALEEYEQTALAALRLQRITPPKEPWPQWRLVSSHFRLHNLRDWVELQASLKWPIDVLVRQGFVQDDSPREMERPTAAPTQVIDRACPGITLTIERATVAYAYGAAPAITQSLGTIRAKRSK